MVAAQLVPIRRLPRTALEPIRNRSDDFAHGVAVPAREGLQTVGYVADCITGMADALFPAVGMLGGGSCRGRSVGHFFSFVICLGYWLKKE